MKPHGLEYFEITFKKCQLKILKFSILKDNFVTSSSSPFLQFFFYY